MGLADAAALPLAGHTAAPRPHVVPRVDATLADTCPLGRPRRRLGDRADDSDPLEQPRAAAGMALMAPPRRPRTRAARPEGRAWRRCRRRWTIARLCAWLNTYQRVMPRGERGAKRFPGVVHLARSMIVLRRVQQY
jgi:hypothetical protein